MNGDLLTGEEHEALRLTGRLAGLLRRIVGDGPAAVGDWAEMAQAVHVVQHAVMAQAAARAYPDMYRPLGGLDGAYGHEVTCSECGLSVAMFEGSAEGPVWTCGCDRRWVWTGEAWRPDLTRSVKHAGT